MNTLIRVNHLSLYMLQYGLKKQKKFIYMKGDKPYLNTDKRLSSVYTKENISCMAVLYTIFL